MQNYYSLNKAAQKCFIHNSINASYIPAKKSLRLGISFMLVLLMLGAYQPSLVAQTPPPLPQLATGANESVFSSIQETYYVATNGSDGNPGTSALPFKTFAKAISKGIERKDLGMKVKIIVRNGTYREKVTIPAVTTDITTSSLIIEAENSGGAIISGSEDWSGEWVLQGSNWTHAWTFDWGIAPSYSQVKNELGRRREMFFVNKVLYTQVLSQADLTAGTYYVDETGDKAYIRPFAGVNMNTALIEVGMLENVFTIRDNRKNIAVKGLVFQHDASFPVGAGGGEGIFRVGKDCSNLLLQDVSLEWNNGAGLGAIDASDLRQDITFRRVKINNNGGGGFSFGNSQNLLFEDCETSFNRFRGKWAGQVIGTSPGGFKLASTHRTSFIRHKAIGNHGRGMWWDIANRDMTAKDCYVDGNYGSGIFVEFNFGPALIENCTIINTKKANDYTLRNQGGMQFASTANLTIKNCIIKNNIQAQIKCWDQQRTMTDHLTGEVKRFDVSNVGNIFLRGNTVEGSDSTHTLIDIPDWTFLISTWDSHNNTYVFPDRNKVFRLYQGGTEEGDETSDSTYFIATNYSFTDWKDIIGNEVNSTFNGSLLFSQTDIFFGHSENYGPLNQTRWSVLGDESNRRYSINTTDYNNLSGSRLGEYSIVQNRSYGSFTMTLNAKSPENLSTNTSADYALVFGFADASNYSYMLLSNDRATTQLFKVASGVRQLIATAPTNKGIINNNYHLITLIRSGNTVTVKRDNIQILSVTNSGIGIAGRVGLGSFNDAAFFDDIDVTGSYTAILSSPATVSNILLIQALTAETESGPETLKVYPNPVIQAGTVRYYLPQAGKVKLELYDGTGRVVAVLVNQEKAAGYHQAELQGQSLKSGIYYCRLQTGKSNRAVKVLIAQ